jgi:3-oxoacyl-[acyl-carrier protein] reductase
MNVTDRASIQVVVDQVMQKHGRIDILINNAGITQDARLVKMTEAQFDAVIDVNLKGVFNCTQLIVPHMLEAKTGAVVNASSVVGIYGNFGQTNYSATKFGMIGFIYPLFIGSPAPNNPDVIKQFDINSCCSSLPHVIVKENVKSLVANLELQGMGAPLKPTATVKDIFHGIISNQGGFVHGSSTTETDAIFCTIADEIVSRVAATNSLLQTSTSLSTNDTSTMIITSDNTATLFEDFQSQIEHLKHENDVLKRENDNLRYSEGVLKGLVGKSAKKGSTKVGILRASGKGKSMRLSSHNHNNNVLLGLSDSGITSEEEEL